jgi:hypothetical protein
MSINTQRTTRRNMNDSWDGEFDESRTRFSRSNARSRSINIMGRNILIGFISWNIGDNINQNKMNELITEYMKQHNSNPDVLVVAFQEVPVDVSMRGTRATFKEKFYKTTGDMLSNSLTHYTILDTYEKNTSSFFTTTNKAKNMNLFTCANIVSGAGGGYGIVTYVFKRKTLPIPVLPIKVAERCVGSTKGYCVVTIQIGDTQTIDIVNTHMPFKDEQKTKAFVNEMLRWLRVHEFHSDSQVILGDLNSRSLLTEDCYAKNITICDDDEEDSKYCYLKEKLEYLSLDDSVKHQPIYSRTRLKKLTEDNCDIEERVSKYRLTYRDNPTPSDLVKVLLKSDVLHVKMKDIFPGFKENLITFLPTYKRDEKTGRFSLSKKENSTVYGRLPGYADRILFKGRMFKNDAVYRSLNVTGNDRLPVAAFSKFVMPASQTRSRKPVMESATSKTKAKSKTKKGGRKSKNTRTRKRK